MKTLRNTINSVILGISLIFNSCNLFLLNKDDNYFGIVVFVYNTQKISDSEKNEIYTGFITDTSSSNGLIYESIEKWFDRESKRYGKNVNLPLSLYPEQIEISQFVNYSSELPVDIFNLSDYLRNNYFLIRNYDFIAIIYSDKENTKQRLHAISSPYFKSFLLRNVYGESGKYNHSFAHEFLHLLGATDKYGNEFEGIYNDSDIMRNNSYRFDEKVKITEPTAREIGW